MTIPEGIEQKLGDQVWKRSSQTGLEDAFLELIVPRSDPFCEFYCKFWGPFRSSGVGHELLDVIEQDESIVTNTRIARRDLGFDNRYLVISSLSGLSILVYDVLSGYVYDVDLEGGDKLLADGQLRPRWQSWWEFTSDYLSW